MSDDEIEAEQVRQVLDRIRRRAALMVVPTKLPAGLSEDELMCGYREESRVIGEGSRGLGG